MKRISIFLLTISIGQLLKAQNVGIGTGTPNSNAALEIKASNKGIRMH
ncbi:MAG: hypothetical protein ABIN67_22905 [Ferruginibacter sp.]